MEKAFSDLEIPLVNNVDANILTTGEQLEMGSFVR